MLPAHERDFHIFISSSIIANKWLISPHNLKIFILFDLLGNVTRPLVVENEDVARDVLWENPEGEITKKYAPSQNVPKSKRLRIQFRESVLGQYTEKERKKTCTYFCLSTDTVI